MKKKIIFFLVLLLGATGTCLADLGNKTTAKEIRKEREEVQKMKAKDLNKELSKIVEKEQLSLSRAGWRSKGGDNMMKSNLEDAKVLEFEFDNYLNRVVFIADGTAIGKNIDLAREKAIEQATTNLADAIQKELKYMLEFAEEEHKILPKDTKVMRATLVTIIPKIASQINDVNVVMELTGAQGANNEIMVRVATQGTNLMNIAKDVIRTELRAKGENYLADRANIVFSWNKATKEEKVKK